MLHLCMHTPVYNCSMRKKVRFLGKFTARAGDIVKLSVKVALG